MSGEEHAERVLSARRQQSDQIQWQIRKGEILRSSIPLFLSQVAEYLSVNAEAFNSRLDLTGDSALQIYACDSYVTITKKSSPVFLGKLSLISGTERARLTAEIVAGLRQPQTVTTEYLFDVRPDGTVELNGMNFCTFAKSLLDRAARLFD